MSILISNMKNPFQVQRVQEKDSEDIKIQLQKMFHPIICPVFYRVESFQLLSEMKQAFCVSKKRRKKRLRERPDFANYVPFKAV